MNIFLVVIFYAITTGGTFTKTETKQFIGAQGDTSMAICELVATRVKHDMVLNTDSSYVFSATCIKEKK